MEFFVDTADTSAIAELSKLGLVDGVTTNPSLIKKSGRDFKEVISEICGLTDGAVSAEVIATQHKRTWCAKDMSWRQSQAMSL